MPTEITSSELTILVYVLVIFVAASFSYIAIKHYKIIWIVLRTSRRDLRGIFRLARNVIRIGIVQFRNNTVGDEFNQTVAKYPCKTCFYFQDQSWNFKDVHELSNKIGNYFSTQGFRKGDVIGIFMENSPLYAITWLGLSKIGVVSALVNTSLREKSLKHSLDIVNCKGLVYSEELSDAVQYLITGGNLSVPIFSYSQKGTVVKLPEAIKLSSVLRDASTKEPVPSEKVNFTDDLLYIYTSGTTGLPKAATIKHARYFLGSLTAHYLHDIKADDILYTCLPLYHSAGGIVGIGQSFLCGTTMALTNKFSASKFWSDCNVYNVTVIQYIGELCRYLLAQPESPLDRQHSVRLMLGNGLRKEIWEKFVERFGIKQVGEIYASTEGNTNITNFDGTVGAVGFVPRWLYPLAHFKIVKVDESTGEIIRDPKTGLGVLCKANEEGEIVGTIVKNHAIKDFQGYAGSAGNTEKKKAQNVIKPGDVVFRSGDRMVMDELGYFYFKDRCGDTFRWKGENVSTTEVESVIASITQLKDCIVYGVLIPNTDGRAGMAAIVDQNNCLDLELLSANIQIKLPAYARPLFLRLTKEIDKTETHKMKKLHMQEEGFDIDRISDPIYFYQGGNYVLLQKPLYHQILAGEVRV